MEAVSVAKLVDAVRRQAPGAALDRVEAALTVSEELASCADELIGQFVEEARRSGGSWTGIGQRAGRAAVGPAHRLAALALDPGSRARRVLSHLGVSMAAVKKELDCYVGPGKRRRRRRGKVDLACSFCGKSQKQVKKLVGGT